MTKATQGITHIEDLPLDDFLYVLDNVDGITTTTEKIDGSALQFGLDECGLYTCREGGPRYYNADDYPITFATSYQRSAHTALTTLLPTLIEYGLSPGMKLETEILYGKVPNVIPYMSLINSIVILRNLSDTEFDVRSVSRHGTNITMNVPVSTDGVTLTHVDEYQLWRIFSVPEKVGPDLIKMSFLFNVDWQLAEYLATVSYLGMTNREIHDLPLNRCPEMIEKSQWAKLKPVVKKERGKVRANVRHITMDIKKDMIDFCLHGVSSSVSSLSQMEGIVCTMPNGIVFKVVDKAGFTDIKEQHWHERDKLQKRGVSPRLCTKFNAKLYLDLGTALGHPDIGTHQATRYVKNLGKDPLIELTRDVDFSCAQDEMKALVTDALVTLDEMREEYAADHVMYIIANTDDLRSAVYKRTMFVYYDTLVRLNTLFDTLNDANNPDELFRAIIPRQLANY